MSNPPSACGALLTVIAVIATVAVVAGLAAAGLMLALPGAVA